MVVIFIILAAFPLFFQQIEKRKGISLNDPILDLLPAYNVSVFIFLTIWAVAALSLWRALQHPDILLDFLWGYILLCLTRVLTITLVPLDTPGHLIPLGDPVSNLFYGSGFVTKDLFFSGHTATVFLLFLCLKKKQDKWLALGGSVLTGFLLLVQHVHYTIDVLAAPVFTYFIYISAVQLLHGKKDRDAGK